MARRPVAPSCSASGWPVTTTSRCSPSPSCPLQLNRSVQVTALQLLSQLPALHPGSGARVRGRSQANVRQGRVHRPGAPAEPASDGPQDEREGAEQGTSGDSFRRRVRGLGGLLLGLVHRLTILLLILLNLSARLILWNVLRAG